jgi:nucleoside phosphorylase
MPVPTLFIFTAVAIEAKAVATALGMRYPTPGKPVTKQLGNCAVSLYIVGIRAKAVRQGIGGDAPSCVLMAGLAGALDPTLAIGDLIIDDLPEGMAMPCGCRQGGICTQDGIVATLEEKARLFADTGAIAVEMENATVRTWAGRLGAAFVAIRAISDRADQTLDPKVLALVDEWGRPRILAIAKMLASRPSSIAHLIRLGKDSKEAAQQLGEAVSEFVIKYVKSHRSRPAEGSRIRQ